jgi:hypothetical protein
VHTTGRKAVSVKYKINKEDVGVSYYISTRKQEITLYKVPLPRGSHSTGIRFNSL